MRAWALIGALVATVAFLALTGTLRESGWPGAARALVAVFPAVFWAAALVAAAEATTGRRWSASSLGLVGLVALAASETLVLAAH